MSERAGRAQDWSEPEAASSALPGGLVRALGWLKAHVAEPIDLDRLADIAGVRPRTLETHFRSYLGATPLGWVRRMRLARARQELLRGDPQTTVTGVALTSGFTQLGRFASHYRQNFGEAPSATLKRTRGANSTFDPVDDEALRLTWRALPCAYAIAPKPCSEALETLEGVQELAPGFGLPVALAAWCWGQRAAHRFNSMQEENRARACALAAKASALAPNDAMTLTLASGALTLAHRLTEAERLLERALTIDPWSPFAWVRRGWASIYMGDADSAVRELETTLYLMPFGPVRHIAFIGMGCAHFSAGRYELAARWVQDGTQAFPAAFWADRIATAAAAQAGARAEARRIARRLLRADPDLTVSGARKAWPFPASFMARLGEGLDMAGVPRR
jgi:AraC-like DNA-binding protein